MAEKHIFIGLGGSGVNTVSLIKYKVYERTKATEMKSRLQVMNDTYRFIFVDTDSRDIENKNKEYRNLYEGGKVDFINKVELLNLGDINPYISYQEAKIYPELRVNRRIMEACPDMVAESMDNRDLSFGAGALRHKSRIAFGRKIGDFVDKLQTAINELNQDEIDSEKNVIHYWVVASSNGGTGSGTVQDVLYYVNMLHRTHVDKGNPKVGLVLYMPRIYMKLIIPQLKGAMGSCITILAMYALRSFDFIVSLVGYTTSSAWTLPVWMYNEAFQSNNFAYSAAISSFLLALVLVLILPLTYWTNRRKA